MEDVGLLVIIVITVQLNKSSMNLYTEELQIVSIYFSFIHFAIKAFYLIINLAVISGNPLL